MTAPGRRHLDRLESQEFEGIRPLNIKPAGDRAMVARACWYRTYELNETGTKKDRIAHTGSFHDWGAELGETGEAYTIAIIEDVKTLCCLTIEVNDVCFAAVPPDGWADRIEPAV